MASEWTNAVRGTQLLWLPIPAYAGLPILLWVFWPRIWTFCLAIGFCIALSILRAKGIKVPWLVRRFKLSLRGKVMHARPVFYRRRVQQLSSFDLVELREESEGKTP
jgi:hypothetical protein